MAKKWAEVVKSEGYQKLPDAEKTAAQEQYFSQIVAPNVPEEDIGVAREQFFSHVSSFAPKSKGPTTFAPPVAEAPKNVGTAADSYGFMGENIEPEAAFVKPRSVMTGVENLPTSRLSKTPLRPEVLKAFESRYDAATPEQRKILEAQPNWMGDVARARADQMEQFDEARKRAPGKTLERVDPRVEARTQALIDKGEKPEFARTAAEDAASAGITPGREVDYARYKGLAEPRPIDEEFAAEFEKASTAKRAIERGRSAIRQDIYGLVQFGADMIGADEFSRQRGLDIAREEKLQNSIGANPDYWKRDFEDAGASIAQQAPIYVVSAVSGGAPIGLSAMWVQQFGGAYAESKKMGLDQPEASERAAWMATAEVLGELPSFGAELKVMRAALKTAPLETLKNWVKKTTLNEAVGEELTYGLQTFGDVKGVTPFGTKEAPTPKQFVEGMVQTFKQTMIQSAMLGGATATVGKAAQLLTGRKPEQELPNIPSAEQLMRDKGFLQGKPTKKGESPLETEAEDKAIRTVGAPEKRVEPTLTKVSPEQKAELRQKRVEDIATRLVETNGLPAEDALKIAEGRVQAEDKAELERQDKLQQGVDKRETLVKPADNRVEELTQDLIGAGLPPNQAAQKALEIAQKEAEDDAIAEAEAKGEQYVGKSVTTAGQPSVGVPSTTTSGSLTGGVAAPVATGLGTAGTTTGESSARKAIQLDTLRDNLRIAEDRLEEVQQKGNDWDIVTHQNDVRVAQEALAKGEADVAQALETEQTETQGQKAPAVGAPKKRGRPALPLDLKAASEQKRTQQRTAYKATEKKLNDAQQLFADANAPIDEGAIQSEEQLREMLDDKRRKRNAAIRTLYDISKTNKGKPGQRAAEALKDPSINPRELADAAQGHELRKKTGAINLSSMSKTVEAAAADTVADEKLGKVTNGAQAITHIIKTGNEFQKILARRIRSAVSGVQIVVVEANQPTPDIFLKNPRYEREWNRARAVYVEGDFDGKKIIYVRGASFGADQGVNNITMLHELLHAATNRKIMLAKQALDNGQYGDKPLLNAFGDLVEVMNNAGERFNELADQGKLPKHISNLAQFGEIFDDPREFLAYGMTDPAMQDFLKTAYGQPSPVGYFNRFVDSIRNFFGMDVNDANALADLINATDSILSAREVGRLEPLGLQISPSIKDLLGFGGKKDETPAFTGESTTVAPSADVERMATMLGAKLYGTPENIAKVSVKELFQNSFDAIKGSLESGQLKEGKINIKLDDKNRVVTITDNGLGMPASVMGKQFLQIAGTVKETKRASGGFGIAKMLFLFENKQLEVVSLRDGELARMVTTGEDLRAALKDPSRGPQLVTTRDPDVIAKYKDMFPEGHGTTVSVTIPETFVDASDGQTKQIPFNNSNLVNSDVLQYSPLFDNVEVTVDKGNGPVTLDIGANFPIDKYTPFANVNFAWGTARVYISKNTESYIWGSNTHVLSNGLWQFDTSISDRPGMGGKPIKRHFYVDVTPKETVRPEDPGYPFDMNRQRFATTVNEDFQKIFNYISAIYSQLDLAGSTKTFGLVQYVNADGTLTKAEQLEPKTPMTDNAFTMIKPGDKVEVRDGVLYVNNRALPELTAEDLEKTSIRLDELTIPQDEIDSNKVMVHDNTALKVDPTKKGMAIEEVQAQLPEGWTSEYEPNGRMPYWAFQPSGEAVGGSTITELIEKLSKNHDIQIKIPPEYAPRSLSEVAREKFGVRYDKYLVEIGETFKAIRAALVQADNSYTAYTPPYSRDPAKNILDEAIGISIDMEYYGVSTIVPFRGMFLNPAVTSLYGNSKQIAASMIGTMLHELAHFKIRSHNADFASEMQHIINVVETSDAFDLQAAKTRLTKHIEANKDIFDFLNTEFRNGNLTASGNRFKDAGYQQIGNASPVGTVEGARASGEELESGVSGGVGPSYQGIGQVGVGAGATSQTKEDGEEAVRTQKEIDKEVDIDLEKIRLSREAEALAQSVGLLQGLRDPRKIIPAMQQLWKNATYQQRKMILAFPLTTEFITTWASEQIPEFKNINILMEKMAGLTQQLLNSAAILAQTIHKAYKEDATLKNKLEELAYASTLAEIDPSDPNAKERSKKLDAMYIGLGAKGQQLYKIIKEHYENLSDYFSHLLDEQIINSKVTPEARERLMAMVRSIYETGSKINPYFPLVRRGDYWLAIGSGKHRQFYTFETMSERDAAAEGFAKERRTPLQQLKEDQTFVLGNDIGSLRRASYDSSGLLKGMFDVIDSQDFTSPEAREELKDAVYQLYLNTMPEQSFRRQFINRKNITGFSTDLLRNISTTGIKMSTQLAKLKYSPLLRNSISAARDSIVGREELEPFVDEMQARINQMMNPAASGKLNAIGTFFNRASFLYYLSGWASALLQPVGVFQTGTTILGARYGYTQTTIELTKMLKIWDQYGITRKNPDGSVSYVPPSIANASGFTADEKRAVREMLGRDVSQSTYASALFGYSSVPTMEFDSKWSKTKRGAAMLTGGLMHTTERLSREMMFMASYRLNRKAGNTHQQSVDAAVIDTNEALGNYGQYNRPIFMQKGIGKVLLQFTMYPLHVTLFLLRNFKKSLPLLNKEGKWEATKIFYGTLGTTFLLAGAPGLPLFSTVMGFLGSFWKDEDKPEELKDMDYETWWRTIWVPENLGHLEIGGVQLGDLVSNVVDRGVVNTVTGLDIASRTSLNDLWLRDLKETKTARESAVALAVEKAGPSANMVLAWADGIEAFMNGQYQKGVEKISPALLRNLVIANRLRTEGAMDNKGAEIIAKGGFTTGELIGKAVGFNPDILANQQRLAFKMQAMEQRIKNERSKLLNNLGREYIEADNSNKPDAWKKYVKRLDEIEKFNTKHPEYVITDENRDDSIDKRLEERAKTEEWSGMRIDMEKATPQQTQAILNATKEIERRKRERE